MPSTAFRMLRFLHVNFASTYETTHVEAGVALDDPRFHFVVADENPSLLPSLDACFRLLQRTASHVARPGPSIRPSTPTKHVGWSASFVLRTYHGDARCACVSRNEWRRRRRRSAAFPSPPGPTAPVEDRSPIPVPNQTMGRDPRRASVRSRRSRVRLRSIGGSFGSTLACPNQAFPFESVGASRGKGRSVRRDPGEFTTRVNSMVRWRLATTTKAKMAMTTTHLSTSEREFVRDGVVEDVRSDGRRRVDFRRVHVQVGNIPQANGSSRVTVGE